jgi:hypothetical protein
VRDPDREIRHATAFPVSGTDTREVLGTGVLAHATPLALLARADEVRGLLPKDATCIFLRTRSLGEEVEFVKRLARDLLVVIASRSSDFRLSGRCRALPGCSWCSS